MELRIDRHSIAAPGVPKRARAFDADLGRATPSNTINMFKFDRDKGLAGGVIHYKGAVTVA
jgi:hypothetical protein